jgi:hypothetical protein
VFKLGFWVRVDSVPRWVEKAYEQERIKWGKWGGGIERGRQFVFTGNSLKYKVKVGKRGKPSNYWAKIK